MMALDRLARLGNNRLALVNPSAGRENPIAQADNRRDGGFFTSVHRYWCAFSMAGRSRASFGWAGSLCAGFSPLLRACHPRREKRLAGIQTAQEAIMPSIALRVVRALFPVFSVPVSTVPTHTQACAMARLLVSQGKRVAIVPAATGFTVSEVKA